MVNLMFKPFKSDSERFSGPIDGCGVSETSSHGGGLLLVTIQCAEGLEGKHHTNPYAVIIYKGERKRTKVRFYKI